MTRRRVLQVGAGATLLAALGRTGTSAAAGKAPLSYLRRSSHLRLVGGTYTVAGVAMTLREVGDLAGSTRGRTLEDHDSAFALRLDGPAALPPGIHPFHHPDMGAFSFYVGPVDAGEGERQDYEVVVDRSVGQPRPPAAQAPSVTVEMPMEPSFEAERAAYAEVAEQVAAAEAAQGRRVDPADLVPSRKQVRKLRKARKRKAPAKRSALARRTVAARRPATRRRVHRRVTARR